MSLPALLDVNVLVALFDPDHVHHETAHDWFEDHRQFGWATCGVTENGFVRVLARVVDDATVTRPAELVDRLRAFQKSGGHRFWSDTVSLVDARLFNPAMIRGHRQVTDIYLLGLAKARGGCLATFDRTIPVDAVVGATTETLQIIAPGVP
jgi:toxin-antitoxin system PIN domain toxin